MRGAWCACSSSSPFHMAVLLAAANGDSKFRQSNIAVHLLKLRKQGARHGEANIPCPRSIYRCATANWRREPAIFSRGGGGHAKEITFSRCSHTHTLSLPETDPSSREKPPRQTSQEPLGTRTKPHTRPPRTRMDAGARRPAAELPIRFSFFPRSCRN